MPKVYSSETKTITEFPEVSKNKSHQIILRLFLCCIHTYIWTICDTTELKTEHFIPAETK